MRSKLLKGAALGALALTVAGAGTAVAAYKLNFGWSPRPHFPQPLIEPSPKPGTWVFKTKLSPELEVRRGNWEMRVSWDRVDQQEWNFTRILQQMLRLGCEVVEPKKAEELITRLYATKSQVRGPDNILHRLTVVESGCVITLEARGPAKQHMLKVVAAPPPPPRPKPAAQPAQPAQPAKPPQ
jgi:hypothetical protein